VTPDAVERVRRIAQTLVVVVVVEVVVVVARGPRHFAQCNDGPGARDRGRHAA
jgi:hypothetical protein